MRPLIETLEMLCNHKPVHILTTTELIQLDQAYAARHVTEVAVLDTKRWGEISHELRTRPDRSTT